MLIFIVIVTANPNLHKREHALNPRQAVSCVLSPEVDTGPYYLNAQLIREDIREGQVGVPVLLDAQVIDVNTCQPIPNIYVDFWSCNSTGTYSGYAVEGTLGLTHLRGIGVTDEDGIAQITTIFPGWYSGRATHIHVATHHNAVANTNTKTITGGTVSHVGQIFFEEKFLTQIDNTAPYNRNTLRRVRNAEDIYVGQAQANGYNSVATSVLLGSNLAQGLASSFTLAVNPGIDYTNGLNSPVRQPGVPVGGGNGGTTTRPGTTPTQPSQPPAGGNLQKYSQCGGLYNPFFL
ncbi:aromatic compound dioxygenase [Ascobolus immersus RN42]|uniref:Aromatic compound dioxygenase n=1 Tax=Ascobolus immersus RN42 TaxID=1160509 RepID=A0A3N4IIE8_ASCIM|nr:aromatic compound dioxygenase [Ascobolus immersus RN42]